MGRLKVKFAYGCIGLVTNFVTGALWAGDHGVSKATRGLFGECDTMERILPGDYHANSQLLAKEAPKQTPQLFAPTSSHPFDKKFGTPSFFDIANNSGTSFTTHEGKPVFNLPAYRYSIGEMLTKCQVNQLNRTSLTALFNKAKASKVELSDGIIWMASLEATLASISDRTLRADLAAQLKALGEKGMMAEPNVGLRQRLLAIQRKFASSTDPESAFATLTEAESQLLGILNDSNELNGNRMSSGETLFGWDLAQYFRFLVQDGEPSKEKMKDSLKPSDPNFLFAKLPKGSTEADKAILNQLRSGFTKKLSDPADMKGASELAHGIQAIKNLSPEAREETRNWIRDNLSEFSTGRIQSSVHGDNKDWFRSAYARSTMQMLGRYLDQSYVPDFENPMDDLKMDDWDYAHLLDVERSVMSERTPQEKKDLEELSKYVQKHMGVSPNAIARLSLAGENPFGESSLEDLNPLHRDLLLRLARDEKTNPHDLSQVIVAPSKTAVMEAALKTPDSRRTLLHLLAEKLTPKNLPPTSLGVSLGDWEKLKHSDATKLHTWLTNTLVDSKADDSTKESLATLLAALEERGHDSKHVGMLHGGNSRFDSRYVQNQVHTRKELERDLPRHDKDILAVVEKFLSDNGGRGLPTVSRNGILALPQTTKQMLADLILQKRKTPKSLKLIEGLILTADQAEIESTHAASRPEVNHYLTQFEAENLGDDIIESLMADGKLNSQANAALTALAKSSLAAELQRLEAAQIQVTPAEAREILNSASTDILGTLQYEAALRLVANSEPGSKQQELAKELLGGDQAIFEGVQEEAKLRRHLAKNLDPFLTSKGFNRLTSPEGKPLPALELSDFSSDALTRLKQEQEELSNTSTQHSRSLERAIAETQNTMMRNEEQASTTPSQRDHLLKANKEELEPNLSALVDQFTKLKESTTTRGAEIEQSILDEINRLRNEAKAQSETEYQQLAEKYVDSHQDRLKEFDRELLVPVIADRLKRYRRLQDQLTALGEAHESMLQPHLARAYKKHRAMGGDGIPTDAKDLAKAIEDSNKKGQETLATRHGKNKKLVAELEAIGAMWDGVSLDFQNANIAKLPAGRFEKIMRELGAWDDFRQGILAAYDANRQPGVFQLNPHTAVVIDSLESKERVPGSDTNIVDEKMSFRPITAEQKRLNAIVEETAKLVDGLPALRQFQEGYFTQTIPKLMHGYPASTIEALGIDLDPRAEAAISGTGRISAYLGLEIKNGEIVSGVDRKIDQVVKKIEANMAEVKKSGSGLVLHYRGIDRAGSDLHSIFQEQMKAHSLAQLQGMKNQVDDIEWTRNLAIEAAVTVPLVMASGGTYAAVRGAALAGRFGSYGRAVRTGLIMARRAGMTAKGIKSMVSFSAKSTTASQALGSYISYYGVSAGGYGTLYEGEHQRMQKYMQRDQGHWEGDKWVPTANGKPDWMDHRDDNKQMLVATDPRYKELRVDSQYDHNENQVPDAAEGTFGFTTHLPRFSSYANQLQRGAITFGLARPLGILAKTGLGGITPKMRYVQNMVGMTGSTVLNEQLISPNLDRMLLSNPSEKQSLTTSLTQAGKNAIYMAPFDDLAAAMLFKRFSYLKPDSKRLMVANWASKGINSVSRAKSGVARQLNRISPVKFNDKVTPAVTIKPNEMLPAAIATPLARAAAFELNQQASGIQAVVEHYLGPKPQGSKGGGYYSAGSNLPSRGIIDAYLKGRTESIWGDWNAGKISANDGLSHFARGRLLEGGDFNALLRAGYAKKDLRSGLDSIEIGELDPSKAAQQDFFAKADARAAGGNIRDAFSTYKAREGTGYFSRQKSWRNDVEPQLQREVAAKLYEEGKLTLTEAVSKIAAPSTPNLTNGKPAGTKPISEWIGKETQAQRAKGGDPAPGKAQSFVNELPVKSVIRTDAQKITVKDPEHRQAIHAVADFYHIRPDEFEDFVVANAKTRGDMKLEDMAQEYLKKMEKLTGRIPYNSSPPRK